MKERDEIQEIEKPRLFHVSPNKEIEFFEPRKENVRDQDEGHVIFATPDIAYATTFLVKSDDSWTFKGKGNGIYFMIISDEERFRNADEGGAIYELQNETFENDPSKNMGSAEWTSRDSVKPIKEETRFYDSSLDAMVDNGVQVFFVDKEFFKKVRIDRENNKIPELLLRLEQEVESENMKRGKNVRKIMHVNR